MYKAAMDKQICQYMLRCMADYFKFLVLNESNRSRSAYSAVFHAFIELICSFVLLV